MKKQTKRIIAAGAVFLVVAGTAGYTVFGNRKQEEEQYIYKEEAVSYGSLTQGITESGSVEMITTDQIYDLDLDLGETDESDSDSEEEEEESRYLRIEEVYVVAGQRIQEGDVVFKLNERSVEAIRRKLKSARNEAQIALAEAQSTYDEEIHTAKQTYDSSVLDGSKAQEEYEISTAVLNGRIMEAYTQIAVLQNEIDVLQAELEDVEEWENYDDLREAYEEAREEYEDCEESRLPKYISLRDAYYQVKEQYEAAKEERLSKSESIEEKQEEIGEVYTQIMRLTQKLERQNTDNRQSYENSVQQGELAQEIYHYSVEGLREDVESARNDLEEADKRLEQFESFVQDGVVYAEGSGLVTAVNYDAGDDLVEEGTMFSYVEEENYVLSIDVSEEDIPYVEVGKEVTITFTAYPDRNYNGIIQEIAASSSDEHMTTISYPVTVKILGDTSELFGGMTGDVNFITDQADDVVYVSRKAIVEENGKKYVYRKNTSGEMELSPVETGFTDGIFVQITEGLSEGDIIYIASKAGSGQSREELQQGALQGGQ